MVWLLCRALNNKLGSIASQSKISSPHQALTLAPLASPQSTPGIARRRPGSAPEPVLIAPGVLAGTRATPARALLSKNFTPGAPAS